MLERKVLEEEAKTVRAKADAERLRASLVSEKKSEKKSPIHRLQGAGRCGTIARLPCE